MKNQALLVSADPAWGRSSGLAKTLEGMGFSVRTDSHVAEYMPAGFELVDCTSERSTIPLSGRMSAASSRLKFAMVTAQVSAATLEHIKDSFDGVLLMPLDEYTLAAALHAHQYITVISREQRVLHERISELVCGDETVAQHFIRLLVDTNIVTLSALRDAFSASLWDAVRSAAHRLNGALRLLDCSSTIALASRLETAAGRQEVGLARAILPVLVDAIENLDAWLQTMLSVTARH